MGTATTTSTLTQLMKTYYDRALLHYAKPSMVIDSLADKSRDIPQREGKTVNFTRYVPLDIVTATTSEGENPDYVEMEAFEFEKTVSKYANSVRLTELVQLTAYDDVLDSAVMLQGENMGRSVNRLYRQAMATGFYPLRVDNSSSYAVSGAVDSASATTVVDATLTQTDNYWNDGIIIFTSGTNKGSVHLVTDFVASTNTVTFTPALEEAPAAEDTFRIVVSTGLDSSDVITTEAVERAVALLKSHNAPKFDGKNYVGIMDPFVEYDFKQDSSWVNAQNYASPENILNGEVGKWGGVRWYEDTEPYMELVTDASDHETTQDRGFGLFAASGTVRHTPIFGAHAIAGTRIDGVKDKLIVKVSGPQDTSNATNAFSLVSWRLFFVATPLNGMFGINLISGASTIA
jgi:hypothetical protein